MCQIGCIWIEEKEELILSQQHFEVCTPLRTLLWAQLTINLERFEAHVLYLSVVPVALSFFKKSQAGIHFVCLSCSEMKSSLLKQTFPLGQLTCLDVTWNEICENTLVQVNCMHAIWILKFHLKRKIGIILKSKIWDPVMDDILGTPQTFFGSLNTNSESSLTETRLKMKIYPSAKALLFLYISCWVFVKGLDPYLKWWLASLTPGLKSNLQN